MRLIAIDQGAATLVAAVIAALASVAASIFSFVPIYLDRQSVGRRRRALVRELSRGDSVRSLRWLSLRVGMTETEIAAMLPDVNAHGVQLRDGSPGAALDSRHRIE